MDNVQEEGLMGKMGNDITPILRTMISQIEECGWTQGILQAESGEVCLEGACNKGLQVLLGNWWEQDDWYENWKIPVAEKLAPAILQLFPGRRGGLFPHRSWSLVVAFNDDPETTQEDVLLVLKHAIGDE